METKIASYQEPGIRLQLVRIEIEDIGSDGIPTSLTKFKYQIRLNRKIVYTTTNENTARRKMVAIIYNNVLQTPINYE